jgi:hypothetical protein
MKTESMKVPSFLEYCRMKESPGILPPSMDCSDIPVPTEEPIRDDYSNNFDYMLAEVDHFNYSFMSKTEVTDFLYRYSQENTRVWINVLESFNDFITGILFL